MIFPDSLLFLQFNQPNKTQSKMDLSNILGALTGNDAASAVSQNLKIDQKQVSSVITAALPYLLGAMQQNASSQAGAASLADALGYHAGNAGNIVDNLKAADLVDGKKILSHIFGAKLSSVLGGVSKSTGVGTNAVGSILASIAPSLLALLGKGQMSSGTNAAGLASMLGMILGGTQSKGNSNSMGGLGSILGSILGQ